MLPLEIQEVGPNVCRQEASGRAQVLRRGRRRNPAQLPRYFYISAQLGDVDSAIDLLISLSLDEAKERVADLRRGEDFPRSACSRRHARDTGGHRCHSLAPTKK